jgi:hypothetical protein
VAALLSVSGCKKQARGGDVALQPLKLPGAELSFPAGEREVHAEQFSGGSVTMRSPYLQVRWNSGSERMVGAEIAAGMLTQAGPDSLPPVIKAMKVAGLDADSVEFEARGVKGRIVTWFCPQDQRQFSLFARVDDGGAALLDRIAATARCDLLPKSAHPKPVFPDFEAPPGFTRMENAWLLGYQKGDEMFVFLAAQQGLSIGEHHPGLRDTLVKMIESALGGQLTEVTDTTQPDHWGQPRWIISANMKSPKLEGESAIVAWTCKGRDLTFVAMHLAPKGSGRGPDGTQILMRAKCP